MPFLSRYQPGQYTDDQFNLEKRIVYHALFVSVSFVVILWLIRFFESEYRLDFSPYGILPRTLKGLSAIFSAPLIHAGTGHLAANSLPLLVLLFSLFFFYRKSAYTIFVLIYLFSGFFVWIVGRDAIHIGASGIIYGLAAFLFGSGILSYNIRLLTISMVVALIYGGMFWGIFPLKPEISWESHLWGAVSGTILAIVFRKSAPPPPLPEEDEDHDDNETFPSGEVIDPESDLPEEKN